MTIKAIQKQLVAAVAMLLVAAIALSSATYAWFVNNTQVTATDVTVTATTASSLQIKHYASGGYGTTTALNSASVELTPVSTVGGTAQITGTSPISFFKSNEWNSNAEVKTFTDATAKLKKTTTGTETATANADDLTCTADSPYYVDTVYFKAGQTSNLYFDSTSTGVVATSSGGLTAFSSVDNDLLKAMRIGVLVSKPDGTDGKFFVYQLNSTASTKAVNTTDSSNLTAKSANGLEAGVKSDSDTAAFTATNIVTFASNTLPTLDDQAITGNASQIVTDVEATKLPLYNFSVTGTDDKTECKAVIYIWMEGCDYDTVAANTTAFATFADKIQLGFCLGTATT